MVTLLWTYKKRWSQSVWTLPALLLGWMHIPALVNYHYQEKGSITILSGNCNYFGGAGAEPAILSAIKFWETQQPDFLCLQEASTDTIANYKYLECAMSNQLGLPNYRFGKGIGRGIYTRNNIESEFYKDFPGCYNGFCYIDTTISGRPVRCYNLHLQSYGLQRANGPLCNLRHIRDGLAQRAEQVDWLVDNIEHCPYPIILCGDCNDVPTSYVYQRLASVLQDGFRVKGSGFAFSHAPLVRIDYIMASKEFEFRRFEYLNSPSFNDHLWVVAEVSWRDQK